MIRKYYFPWFFSGCKKISRYIGKYFKKTFSNNTSKLGSNERKIFDFYKNMNLKDNDFKLIQKKLSWPYQIAVFNLNSNLNVGAIYRTGCLLGMEKYLVLGKKIYNPKSQVGLDYVPIEYLDTFKYLRNRNDSKTIETFNLEFFIKYIKENNLVPILIEQGGTNLINVNFSHIKKNLKLNERLLFIFGNETHGISTNLINCAKKNKWITISIPQWGCAHSYNVSQAANIIMWKFYEDNIIHLRNYL